MPRGANAAPIRGARLQPDGSKRVAIGCYKSQFQPPKADVYPRVRVTAKAVDLMAGCAAGELLSGLRMPVTAEPLRMLFPPR